MKTLIGIGMLVVLGGCGAETATTAAAGAATKQREIEEGKKTMDRTRQSVDAAMEQAQKRTASETDKQ